MFNQNLFLLASMALTCLWFAHAAAEPQSTAFNCQGVLTDGDTPVTGTPDVEFRLYDDLVDGNPIGPPQLFEQYPVSDGLLSVNLDFGRDTLENAALDGFPFVFRDPILTSKSGIDVQNLTALDALFASGASLQQIKGCVFEPLACTLDVVDSLKQSLTTRCHLSVRRWRLCRVFETQRS